MAMILSTRDVHGDKIQLPMTNPPFCHHGCGECPNGRGGPAQDDALEAIFMIKVSMHGGDSQVVLAML